MQQIATKLEATAKGLNSDMLILYMIVYIYTWWSILEDDIIHVYPFNIICSICWKLGSLDSVILEDISSYLLLWDVLKSWSN